MNQKTKPRYHISEGITDALSAHLAIGAIISFTSAGFWLWQGLTVAMIVVLVFLVNFPRQKLQIYTLSLLIFVGTLIVHNIRYDDPALDITWIVLLVLGMTQAFLIIHYKKRTQSPS